LEPDWHGSATETLWAEPVAGRRYRIQNTPFYVKGLSYHDVVFAHPGEPALAFAGIALRGGHSTYRVIHKPPLASELFLRHWLPLESTECSHEQGIANLLAIDVPPKADINSVYRLLESGEAGGVWDFEENDLAQQVHSEALNLLGCGTDRHEVPTS
jgi:Domain of unknown function (DUF4265)